jgi:hypothetical protein
MTISEGHNPIDNSEKEMAHFEFDDLPKELRIKIFQHLAVKDLMQAAMVFNTFKLSRMNHFRIINPLYM